MKIKISDSSTELKFYSIYVLYLADLIVLITITFLLIFGEYSQVCLFSALLILFSTMTFLYKIFIDKLCIVEIDDEYVYLQRKSIKDKISWSELYSYKYHPYIPIIMAEEIIVLTFKKECKFGKIIYIDPTRINEKGQFKMNMSILNIISEKKKLFDKMQTNK